MKRLTKSDAIRKAIGARGATFYEIRGRVEARLKQVIGKQRLRTLLSVMKVNGEIDANGRGDERRYVLKRRPVG